jgi:hypothetical protein
VTEIMVLLAKASQEVSMSIQAITWSPNSSPTCCLLYQISSPNQTPISTNSEDIYDQYILLPSKHHLWSQFQEFNCMRQTTTAAFVNHFFVPLRAQNIAGLGK